MPLHKKIFFALLLFLPTQLALHLWPDWSYIIGHRVDFLSPTIYFTDILILACVIARSDVTSDRGNPIRIKNRLIILMMGLFILLNIIFSSIPYLTFYKWLKILEFFLLSLYIIKNINLKKDWENIVKILSIGVMFESLLAILQFINQSSLNGIFYLFGERNFNATTPGIAKAAINGALLLRPYATLPHPNVLGGYLAVLLPIILVTDFKPMKIKWLAFTIGLVTLVLTFSRPSILIGFLAIIIAWIFENFKKRFYLFPLLLIFFILLIFFFQNVSLEKESIDRRVSLNSSALKMFQQKPLVGVGLGNFIPRLPLYSSDKEVVRFLQPAHNIYLLILSETGIIGLIMFLGLIIKAFNKTNNYIFRISMFSILVLGVLDHYFITLQQTQTIFTIIISMALIKYPNED